jgi:hypothetical protein
MQIVGDDHVAAGHRLEENFNYPDGTPIKYIPGGSSPQEAWDNLELAFANKLPKPDELPLRKKKKVVKKKRSRS